MKDDTIEFFETIPRWTVSLDAAVDLCEAKLPGAWIDLRGPRKYLNLPSPVPNYWSVRLDDWKGHGDYDGWELPRPSLSVPPSYGLSVLARGGVVTRTETCAKLAEFLRYALNAAWEGCGLDGGDIQDTAERFGLIVSVKYHEATHGPNSVGAQDGDDWFVIAPDIARRAILPTQRGQDGE